MSDINEFDKIIKDKMGGFSEMPPSHLWGNISAGIVPKAARIPFYQQAYFKISLLIASIAVILSISWFVPQNPTYNTISSNIENIQNTKNNIINSNTSANNNTENIKENIEKEAIVKNTIIEPQEEKFNKSELKNATVISSNYSQKQNKSRVIPSTIAANYSKKNNISNKAKLSQKLTIENSDKNVVANENSNKEIKNSSSERDLENSSKKIVAVAITTPNEIVKEEIILENNEEVIAETTVNKELVPKEETPEPIQEPVEETQEEEVANNISVTPIAEDVSQKPDDKMPKSNFNPKNIVYDTYSIGAHYGYEQINIGNLNVASNNFDLSFNFQNVNFIAQTGIGFQISKDKNSYTQHYTRNEYLATQVRFDSIAFVDNGNGGFDAIPINPYYTDVYDSIKHTHNDETIETYYTLRIPLFIGYKKSLKYFDVFAQGGIIYSHIFKNKTGEMNQLDSESRMLESEYLINERQDNQLQYVAAAGLSYGITERLYLNAELMAKYYHYSLYKNTQSNTNTWSYEARFGVTYLLN